MRISDWSSDVCSSDLRLTALHAELAELEGAGDALELLAARRQQLQHDYTDAAAQLSQARQAFAERLGEEVSLLMGELRSGEHTSELQSLMRSSSAVFCLQKKIRQQPKAPMKHLS